MDGQFSKNPPFAEQQPQQPQQLQQQPQMNYPPQPYPPQPQDPYAQQPQQPLSYPPQPYPQDPYAQPPQQPQQLPYPPQPYPQDPYAQQVAPYPPQQQHPFAPSPYPPQQTPYMPTHYPQQSYDLGAPPPQTVYVVQKPHGHCSKEETTHAILCRDYRINICPWIGQAWSIYKTCWWGFSGTYLVFLLLCLIPYIGFILTLLNYFLVSAWFIAAANSLRSGQPVRFSDFSLGINFVLWIFLQSLLIGLAVMLGFVFFIIPGLILLVLFSFSWYVFIEYKSNGIDIIDGMSLSAKVCWKKFWWIVLFNITMFGLAISGILLLGVGLLVTVPLVTITYAVAFQEIFGLNMSVAEGEWQQREV